jgi:hypothetical protein
MMFLSENIYSSFVEQVYIHIFFYLSMHNARIYKFHFARQIGYDFAVSIGILKKKTSGKGLFHDVTIMYFRCSDKIPYVKLYNKDTELKCFIV